MPDANPNPAAGAPTPARHQITCLPWLPLLAGVAATYGPVALNYGIALYFLNYRHGFVKRGLVGELVLALPHLSRAGLIALQVAFILAAFAATYRVLRHLLFGSNEDRMLAAVLLTAPAMLPHLGFLFAQPDVTLYLLLLAALAAMLKLDPTPGTALASALAVVAMLAHEAFSLAFYPLILAILWDRCRRRELRWTIAAADIAAVTAAFLAILHYGKLKVQPAAILADAAQRTNVPLQPQVFEVMASTFGQQRALVRHFYHGGLLIVLGLTLLLSLPYVYMLVSLLRRAGRERGYKMPDAAALTLLFLLPLSLCYLGHDVSRWISASAIDATLFLCYLALSDLQVRASLRVWAAQPQATAWLAWGLITGPYGATGLRVVEQMAVLWKGP